MTHLHRRRFMMISAAALCAPVAAGAATWSGRAMGTRVSMRLEGVTPDAAAPIFAALEAELLRLEDIFSLYRPGSQLSQLNSAKHLRAPAPELLQVLSMAARLHQASEGAFDPSIQPLWAALAQNAPAPALRAARAAVGWGQLRFDSTEVRLAPGGALTLNGIAQGAITDAIAQQLRQAGLRDCLVDMGEIAALGAHQDGAPWAVGVRGPQERLLKRMTLRDRALATSSPGAMMLDPAHQTGHILHPQGQPARANTVAVSAPSAMVADGLSTALCLVPRARAQAVLRHFPGAHIEVLA